MQQGRGGGRSMDAALAALDGAVQALVAAVPAPAHAHTHPLCECAVIRAPAPAWRYLRRFPVLKRHVLERWQTATQRASDAKSSRKRAAMEMEAQSLDALCLVLAQCGLLSLREPELVRTVVTTARPGALRRVILGSSLPLRLRLLLLGFALQERDMTHTSHEDLDWVADVAEKALEGVLEAVAQTARGSTGNVTPSSRKRRRTVTSRPETAADKVATELQCAFCREGGNASSLRSPAGGWDFLSTCVQHCVRELEAAGEKPASNRALAALLSFRNATPTSETTATKPSSQTTRSSRRRGRIMLPTLAFMAKDAGPALSLDVYERLCQEATEAPPVVSQHGDVHGAGLQSRDLVAVRVLWESVWRRELEWFARTTSLSLTDVVSHCSKTDAFALMVAASATASNVQMRQLLGFRVVEKVVDYFAADKASVISAFAQSWNHSGSDLSSVAGLRGTRFGALASPSLKFIQRGYLRVLLARRPTPHRETAARSGTHLSALLFSLFVVFFEPIPGDPVAASSCSEQWDALLAQKHEDLPTTPHPRDGMAWCLALEECVKAVQAESNPSHGVRSQEFLQAFREYCLAVGYNVLATDGDTISSGGNLRWPLIRSADDRPAVRRTLAHMMSAFGDSWVCSLVSRLLRMESGLRRPGERGRRVIKTLLFPALVSYMKRTIQADRQRRRTGRQQFIGIVHAVNGTMKANDLTWLYLPSLMRFCGAWDLFHRTHTKDPLPRDEQWGFRAMTELDMFSELLDCYARSDVIALETSATLAFTAEVLQNTSSCPPALESKVFEVVSSVRAAIDRYGDDSSLAQAQVDLVSHPNDVVQRLLRAVNFADTLQTQWLLQQAKHDLGGFGELKLQLQRWLSTMEMHGSHIVGKESRLHVAMLCSRLIRWFPEDFADLRLLVNPLDSHLVYAFKSFVKDSKRSSGIADRGSFLVSGSSRASSSSLSAVRLEMATRAYVSGSALPDFAGLTALLIKSLVKCRSPEAHKALVKIALKNASILLSEVAVETLAPALQGVAFPVSDLAPFSGDDKDERAKEDQFLARKKAILRQRNALKVLEASCCLFEAGIPWSSSLFGNKAAETWLPHLFEFVLATDLRGELDQASVLLSSVETLARTPKVAVMVLRQSYWLEALFCTACFAFSTRIAGAELTQSQRRLRDITEKIRLAVSLSQVDRLRESDEKDLASQESLGWDRSSLLVQLSATKSGKVKVGERGLCWSSDHLANRETASSTQLLVPFSCWLTGALVYSEAFVEDPRDDMRSWERTFANYVTGLYLSLEFDRDVGKLLAAWVATWVCCNVTRSEEGQALLALLPFQVSLFRRLGSSSSSKRVISTALWELVFVGIDVAVNRPGALEDPTRLAQVAEVVVGSLATLELVDLSAAADNGDAEDRRRVLGRVEGLLSRPQLRACGAGLLCYLLQFPLELLVSVYVCKIPVDAELEAAQFLQRVEYLVHDGFRFKSVGNPSMTGELQGWGKDDRLADSIGTKAADTERGPLHADEKNPRDSVAGVELAEVAAFMQDWAAQMRLKFEYLDSQRCAEVLDVITAAFPVIGTASK